MIHSEDIPASLQSLLAEAEEYILAHHVSLGDSPGDPSLISSNPKGSGTFVSFSIQEDTVIYGILTAAHVIRKLKLVINNNGYQFLGLSKLQKGDTIACSITFPFIYLIASKELFHAESKDAYRPDIAFIALGANNLSGSHELITDSLFYDLDNNQDLEISNPQIFSAFYKGAGNLRPDSLLNTFAAFGGGETIKFDEKAQIHYWQIPNDSGESIAGGSGAGFWRFLYENGVLLKSLEGIITAEDPNRNFFEAMEILYLYNSFLPKLRSIA